MKVVITGVGGYIGTRLCERLQADGEVREVVGIDLRPPRAQLPKVRFVQRDVTRPLADLFDGADVAVHLAWVLDPIKDGARMTAVNLGGTRRFLEACGIAGVTRVIAVSSATAYGAHPRNPVPMPESHPIDCEQRYQYAREKAVMEGMARAWREFHPGARLCVVRPAIVIGPRVYNFISRAMMKAAVPLVEGADPPVQFVHEEDVAAALHALVRRCPEGTFNLGAPGTVSTRELARTLRARVLDVSERTARAIAEVGWRLGLRQVTEAPPELLDFLRYPWVVDGSRITRECGVEYRYDTRAALATFVAAHPRRFAGR